MALTAACGEMLGGVVSCTVMWKLPVAMLFAPSVALQLTVVVVMPKVLPEAGVHETGTLPLTMSFAVALKVTARPDGPAASPVMSDGKVSTGFVVSTTV